MNMSKLTNHTQGREMSEVSMLQANSVNIHNDAVPFDGENEAVARPAFTRLFRPARRFLLGSLLQVDQPFPPILEGDERFEDAFEDWELVNENASSINATLHRRTNSDELMDIFDRITMEDIPDMADFYHAVDCQCVACVDPEVVKVPAEIWENEDYLLEQEQLVRRRDAVYAAWDAVEEAEQEENNALYADALIEHEEFDAETFIISNTKSAAEEEILYRFGPRGLEMIKSLDNQVEVEEAHFRWHVGNSGREVIQELEQSNLTELALELKEDNRKTWKVNLLYSRKATVERQKRRLEKKERRRIRKKRRHIFQSNIRYEPLIPEGVIQKCRDFMVPVRSRMDPAGIVANVNSVATTCANWVFRDPQGPAGLEPPAELANNLVREIQETTIPNDSTNKGDKMMECLFKISSLLIMVSNSNSSEMLASNIVAWMLAQITSERLNRWRTEPCFPRLMQQLYEVFKVNVDETTGAATTTGDLIAEGVISDARKYISGIRNFNSHFTSTPLAELVRHGMLICTFFGILPDSLTIRGYDFGIILSKFTPSISPVINAFDILDSFLGIAEFTLTVLELVQGGYSIMDFIFPTDMCKRLGDITSDSDRVAVGKKPEHFNSEAMLLQSARSLYNELGRCLTKRNVPFSFSLNYQAQYTRLAGIISTLEDLHGRSALRVQPACFVFSGPPNQGKSFMVRMLQEALETATGKKYTGECCHVWNNIDDFQSGYTNAIEFILFDDQSNTIITRANADKSALSHAVGIINNTPMLTNQASLEGKGNIYYKPDVVCMTTNVFHLQANMVSNDPQSIHRRMFYMECGVLPRYQKNYGGNNPGDDHLDSSKCPTDEDGIPCNPNRIYFYEVIDIGPGSVRKRIIPKTLEDDPWIKEVYAPRVAGKSDDDPAWWISGPHIYRLCVLHFTNHMKQQNSYLKSVRDAKKLPRCPGCKQFKSSQWCQCTEIVVPEAIMEYLMTNFVEHSIVQCASYWKMTGIQKASNNVHLAFLYTQVRWCKFYSSIFFNASFNKRMILIAIGQFIFYFIFVLPAQKCYGSNNQALIAYYTFLSSCICFNVYMFLLGCDRYTNVRIEQELRATGSYLRNSTPLQHLSLYHFAAMGTSVYAAYSVARKFWDLQRFNEPQGNMQPICAREIEERVVEKNQWATKKIKLVPFKSHSRRLTMSREVREEYLQRGSVGITLAKNGRVVRTMGFSWSPQTTVILKHSFDSLCELAGRDDFQFTYTQRISYTVHREDTQCIAHTLSKCGNYVAMHLNHAFGVKQNSLAIQSTIAEQTLTVTAPFHLYTLERDENENYTCMFKRRAVNGTYKYQTNGFEKGNGWEYEYAVNDSTQNGDCMSPLVCVDTGLIVGFHIGANAAGTVGFALPISIDTFPEKDLFVAEGMCMVRKEFGFKENLPALKYKCGSTKELVVQEHVHPRDCINFIPDETVGIFNDDGTITKIEDVNLDITAFGTCDQTRSTPSSEIEYYPYVKALEEVGIPCTIGPPKHNANRDHAQYFAIALHPVKAFDRRAIRWAKDDYLRTFHNAINPVLLDEECAIPRTPITIRTALNGVRGNRYLRKINQDTSAGLLFEGKKHEHLIYNSELDVYEPTPQLEAAINDVLRTWKSGTLTYTPVKTAIKDQAVTRQEFTSNGQKKVRIFNVYEMAVFIASKMLLAPILYLINAFPLASEQLQNTHVFGDEWKQIYDHIVQFKDQKGTIRVFDGDFSKLDQHLSGYLIREAGDILVTMAKFLGYTQDNIVAVNTLVRDLATTLFFYNGAVFCMDSVNTSGNLLTVVLNALGITIGNRCAYYRWWVTHLSSKLLYKFSSLETIEEKIPPYAQNVHSGFVGDDSLVSTVLEWFDQQYLAQFWREYGMKFTDGRKSEVPEPFSTPERVVLCKRQFRPMDLYGKEIVAPPLDQESIWRALQCHKKTEENTTKIWCDQVVNALRSFAFYEKERFLEEQERIEKLLHHTDVQLAQSVPEVKRTYEEWWDIFHKAYYCDDPDPDYEHVHYNSPKSIVEDALCAEGVRESSTCTYKNKKYKNYKNYTDVRNRQRKLASDVIFLIIQTLICLGYLCVMLITTQGIQILHMSNNTSVRLIPLTPVKNNWITKEDINLDVGAQSVVASHDIVEIQHDNPGSEASYLYGIDAVAKETVDNISNDSFFKRPVKILDFYWQLDVSAYLAIDPWSLFCEDARNINRLAHFKNLRGTLHVEFSLSANVFYYGKLLANYVPLPDSDSYTMCRQGIRPDLVEASQRPHVLLDANSSQGGSLICPFIHPQNSVDITTRQYNELGLIYVTTMNKLRHINSGSQPVHVVAYAWMEDIQFSIPTTVTPVGLVPQGMEEMSARIHHKANVMLSRAAPMLTAFKTGLELANSFMQNIGYLYGFSRPIVTPLVSTVVKFGSLMSASNTNRFTKNLSLDYHKQVIVDPRIAGINGVDEMAFGNIATKECYLTTFTMSSTKANGELLWNARVSPINTLKNGNEFHMTPSAWVGCLFKYWRGSMTYRFQCVCSPMHRARVRIVWDPLFLSGSTTTYNTACSKIFDVSAMTDEEITIDWGQCTSYLEMPIMTNGPYQDVQPYTTSNARFNGVIGVYVINSLSTPNEEVAEIDFNVYVRPGDDIEFVEMHSSAISLNKLSIAPKVLPPPYYEPPVPGNPSSTVVVTQENPNLVILQDSLDFNNYGLTGNPPLNLYEEDCLINSTNTYQYVIYGQNAANVVTLVLENPSASAGSITVTFGSQVGTATWAANQIGVQKTLNFTVSSAGTGRNIIPFTVTNNTIGSRVWVRDATNIKPSNFTKVFKSAAQITTLLGSSVTADGNYMYHLNSINPLKVTLPGAVPNSIAQMWLHTPATIGGNKYSGTYPVSLPPPGGSARLVNFNLDSTGSFTLSGTEGGVIYGGGIFYFSQYGPQGIEVDNNSGAGEQAGRSMSCGENVHLEANRVFFGEQYLSWRTVLKRAHVVLRINKKIAGLLDTNLNTCPTYLQNTDDASAALSTVKNLFDWIEPAYLAQRGSYVFTLVPFSRDGLGDVYFYYQRQISGTTYSQSTTVTGGQGTQVPWDMTLGLEMDKNSFCQTGEINIPWYSRFRFRPARLAASSAYDTFWRLGINGSSTNSIWWMAASAGEDYSLSCFVSTPVVFV